MLTIRTTDLPNHAARVENLFAGKVEVISRSGLHPTERLLFENLAALPQAPTSLLVAGNRTGAIAMAAARLFPDCTVHSHAFDLYHMRAIIRNIEANGLTTTFSHDEGMLCAAIAAGQAAAGQAAAAPRIATHCTAELPRGPHDAILFMATPETMAGELILDQLQDIQRNLADDGICLIACGGAIGALAKQVDGLFGGHRMLYDKGGLYCLRVHKKREPRRTRNFEATFMASLPGMEPIELVSLPGTFSHRRPDSGGLALAEVAARGLQTKQSLLDMGCGSGMVGLLLASSLPGTHVTFLDSHARALAAVQRNLTRLGLADKSRLVLSDMGLPDTLAGEGAYELFTGNPPYFSDYRIAQLFIRTAFQALAPGGVCYTVAKNARGLHQRQAVLFGRAEILPRRGYGIVRSVR